MFSVDMTSCSLRRWETILLLNFLLCFVFCWCHVWCAWPNHIMWSQNMASILSPASNETVLRVGDVDLINNASTIVNLFWQLVLKITLVLSTTVERNLSLGSLWCKLKCLFMADGDVGDMWRERRRERVVVVSPM